MNVKLSSFKYDEKGDSTECQEFVDQLEDRLELAQALHVVLGIALPPCDDSPRAPPPSPSHLFSSLYFKSHVIHIILSYTSTLGRCVSFNDFLTSQLQALARRKKELHLCQWMFVLLTQRNSKFVMSSWFREVCTVKVGDIVKDKREMVAVEAHTPVGEVLDILREENLTSVGVYGTPGSWLGSGGVNLVSDHKQYIGVVSIVDLLNFILSEEDVEARINSRVVVAIGSTQESMSLWVESYDRPLYFAMEQFCKGTHRALAYDEKVPNSPIKFFTQTDVVHYLIRHNSALPHLKSVFDSPVGGIAVHEVDVLAECCSMHDALRMLLVHHALPVVNSSDSIIATLSASDLRGFDSTAMALLAKQTVLEFLQAIGGDSEGNVRPPLMGTVDMTVKAAAHTMLRHKVHRLWISPCTASPRGAVVTYTDIIRAVYSAEH